MMDEWIGTFVGEIQGLLGVTSGSDSQFFGRGFLRRIKLITGTDIVLSQGRTDNNRKY